MQGDSLVEMQSDPMEPVPCTRCGTFIRARTDLLYSDSGEAMCVGCREALDEPRRRTLKAATPPIVWRALGAAVWAVLGLPLTLLLVGGAVVASLPSLATGLVVLSHLKHDDELKDALGARLHLVRISAWVSVVFGALGGLVTLVRLASLLP
jgi:hypothetical protein